MPHTSDFMYDMSLIREGIIVDSVEGKITVNSIQSTTKDRGIGDNVYVWAYNFLNLVEFMKQNPSMVQMGLSLINKNNAVWKK